MILFQYIIDMRNIVCSNLVPTVSSNWVYKNCLLISTVYAVVPVTWLIELGSTRNTALLAGVAVLPCAVSTLVTLDVDTSSSESESSSKPNGFGFGLL